MTATEWGNWTYDSAGFTLTHVRKGSQEDYCVCLEERVDSAKTLDWIMQLVHKKWIGAQDALDFLNALDDVLSPQSNMCSRGMSTRIDPQEVARKRGYTVTEP